ncbi:ribosome biogenesis GTPase YlqF [Clostridia bacterium OttesenSCG-928-F22]|nr:ribosome biogenesis GTPase YlqF [Clostridia bacterium OttesenSCG-928-F22]
MHINWYPGHMTKAKRMIAENVSQVDLVAELLDARIPLSSRNADFEELFKTRKRLIILNKSDLADEAQTKDWEAYYKENGFSVFSFCSIQGGNKKALAGIQEAASEIVERYKKKGVTKTVRVLVAGIPNVGKSAFINALGSGAKAKTGDKPGVTRGKQWIKVSPYLELLDTPGILWPKLENQAFAARLAYVGCINDGILQGDKLCAMLLEELRESYPVLLQKKYDINTQQGTGLDMLEEIAQKRGFLRAGAALDMERAAAIVLDEFRAGRLGRITLDTLREA